MRPDLSQPVSFACPECQTEGFTNLGATVESVDVEVTCDYCQRVVVVALGGEHRLATSSVSARAGTSRFREGTPYATPEVGTGSTPFDQ